MTSADDFRLGMRRLVSSVCLITTVEDGKRHGLVATAVSSVSADPPTLLVCINRSASIHDPLKRAGFFCVNVLGTDHQALSAHFSDPALRDRRFDMGQWATLTTGAPALVGAPVAFDCQTTDYVDASTHTIVLGRIVDVRLGDPLPPLAYLGGRYGSFAESLGSSSI